MSFYLYCRVYRIISKRWTDQSCENSFGYFFEVVRGTDYRKPADDFCLTSNTQSTDPGVLDRPKHWRHNNSRGCVTTHSGLMNFQETSGPKYLHINHRNQNRPKSPHPFSISSDRLLFQFNNLSSFISNVTNSAVITG